MHRPWIAHAVALVFLAGLAHIWLHDAHIDDHGHFGTAVEQTCTLEKLTSTLCVAIPSQRLTIQPGEVARLRTWSRVATLDISTAPRGPPIA